MRRTRWILVVMLMTMTMMAMAVAIRGPTIRPCQHTRLRIFTVPMHPTQPVSISQPSLFRIRQSPLLTA